MPRESKTWLIEARNENYRPPSSAPNRRLDGTASTGPTSRPMNGNRLALWAAIVRDVLLPPGRGPSPGVAR